MQVQWNTDIAIELHNYTILLIYNNFFATIGEI